VIAIVDTAIQIQWRIFDQLLSRTELKYLTRRWRKSDDRSTGKNLGRLLSFISVDPWGEVDENYKIVILQVSDNVLCRVSVSACFVYGKLFAHKTFHFRWATYLIFLMWMRKIFHIKLIYISYRCVIQCFISFLISGLVRLPGFPLKKRKIFVDKISFKKYKKIQIVWYFNCTYLDILPYLTIVYPVLRTEKKRKFTGKT
jgi:hypothetical protein